MCCYNEIPHIFMVQPLLITQFQSHFYFFRYLLQQHHALCTNFCLSPVVLLQQNARDWLIYKVRKCMSHSTGGWKFKTVVLVVLVSDEGLVSNSKMVHGEKCKVPTWRKGQKDQNRPRQFPLVLFLRPLIPFMRALPSGLNHLLKAPLPNSITWLLNFNV